MLEVAEKSAAAPERAIARSRALTIVQVASCFSSWGGMELHLLNLGSQLRNRGHRVIVAARHDGWVVQKARSLSLPTFEATVRRQQDFTDFWRYYRMYKEERVDVVHVHCDQDAVAPALAAHLAGVPVVVMSWHLPFPFKGRGGRLLTILYNRIFAVSHSVRNTQLEGGAPPHKIEVVHHGTDVEGFQMLTVGPVQIRAELNLAPDHVAVGIVGRISPEKGHRHLLAALRLIKDRYSHLRVVIIGAGPDEALLRAEAAADHLDEQVIFAGFRDPVNNAINAMDIVVAPSTWQEPCSAAVQQAMILAKPVIGTRVGGTPEMIADGETGLLVAPGDPGALADAIGRLADEPEARRAMGQAGRRRAEREFSLQGMADKIEQFYLQMYDARSGGVRQPDALAH